MLRAGPTIGPAAFAGVPGVGVGLIGQVLWKADSPAITASASLPKKYLTSFIGPMVQDPVFRMLASSPGSTAL